MGKRFYFYIEEIAECRACYNGIWSERSSDGLNLELPTEMAEIKVAKK